MVPVWIPMDCCMLKVTFLKNCVKKRRTTRFTPVWISEIVLKGLKTNTKIGVVYL